MAHLYLLFSHQLTREQEEDVKNLGAGRCIELPEPLQSIWSSIPPYLERIHSLLEPIKNWLLEEAENGDYILIQGDFGATFIMAAWSQKKGFIPVYATTERRSVEEIGEDGAVWKRTKFKHVRFRRYGL